jgi:hypothetical protein
MDREGWTGYLTGGQAAISGCGYREEEDTEEYSRI